MAQLDPFMRFGMQVIDAESGATVVDINSTKRFVPASTAKLLTALSALHFLGAGHRFTTDLLTDKAPDAQGAVGTLFVRGSGDSSTPREAFIAMAAELRRQGFTHVEGNLVVDDSAFEPVRWGYSWAWDDRNDYYSAPVGALNLSGNVVTVTISPGPKVGAPGAVTLEPTSRYCSVTHEVQTVADDPTDPVRIETPSNTIEGILPGASLRVSGCIGVGAAPIVRTFAVSDGAQLAAAALAEALREQRIAIDGQVTRSVTADGAQVLARHVSGAQVPGEAKLILSLRQDIAKVGDANSLQNWLREPQNSVYGADGSLQGVTFKFNPPLQNIYCGERLHWVAVNMQGNWNVQNVNYANIVVSKRTVFASQWCNVSDGTLEQGHVYSGGNPFTGFNDSSALPVDSGYYDDGLQASINAAPQDFANRTTAPDDGLALGGMGLYGEYEVFIPAEVLAHFPLTQLEDVVIDLHFNNLTQQRTH